MYHHADSDHLSFGLCPLRIPDDPQPTSETSREDGSESDVTGEGEVGGEGGGGVPVGAPLFSKAGARRLCRRAGD